eukprot:294415-Amorphochlora_amoeboformis.AAC.2
MRGGVCGPSHGLSLTSFLGLLSVFVVNDFFGQNIVGICVDAFDRNENAIGNASSCGPLAASRRHFERCFTTRCHRLCRENFAEKENVIL